MKGLSNGTSNGSSNDGNRGDSDGRDGRRLARRDTGGEKVSDLYLTQIEKDEVRTAIDWFEWKHSWHLPKDCNGYTDWHSDETLRKCLAVLADHRRNMLAFAVRCDRLAGRLEAVIAARKADEEESE